MVIKDANAKPNDLEARFDIRSYRLVTQDYTSWAGILSFLMCTLTKSSFSFHLLSFFIILVTYPSLFDLYTLFSFPAPFL